MQGRRKDGIAMLNATARGHVTTRWVSQTRHSGALAPDAPSTGDDTIRRPQLRIDFSPDRAYLRHQQNTTQIGSSTARAAGHLNFGRSETYLSTFNPPHGIAVDAKATSTCDKRGSGCTRSDRNPGPSQAAAPAAAAPAPPPKVAPTGPPAHAVDVMTAEGVAVFGGPWRNMDARIVEAPPRPNAGPWKVSYDLQPKAGDANFDDSSWPAIDAKALAERRGGGGVFMTWYRINLTIPREPATLIPRAPSRCSTSSSTTTQRCG